MNTCRRLLGFVLLVTFLAATSAYGEVRGTDPKPHDLPVKTILLMLTLVPWIVV